MRLRSLRNSSLLALALLLLCGFRCGAEGVTAVEPPCWWTGMETPLQLMLRGDNLKGASVKVSPRVRGLKVKAVHDADSPSYLFVDVKISRRARPGTYRFEVRTDDGSRHAFDYTLSARRDGSAERASFTPADVIYLLMPDRFANGDTRNDSTPETAEKADISLAGGRHGGDLQGIMDRLDELSFLGVTALWSTPLLLDDEVRYSYHGYACADFYRVDPRFGGNEKYLEYVSAAHERGMKVIMDMVPNHCGTAHWWMKDLPFHDWLNTPGNIGIESRDEMCITNGAMSVQSDPHASEYDSRQCIEGWFDTTMPDLNLTSPYLHRYLVQNAVWWVEYADLDGIRVDTFPYSDKEAISDWCAAIRREYPNLNMVGECWFGDAAQCAYWEGRTQADGFNSNLGAVMDFPLRQSLVDAFTGKCESWERSLVKVYNTVSLDFLYGNPGGLMIFAGNHDTNRLAHMLDGNLDRIRMVYAILATMRGIPQIYYGDEFGMRAPDGRTGHSEERMDFWRFEPDSAQLALRDDISRMMRWRKGSRAVAEGSLLHFRPTDSNVYVYFRIVEDETVMVVINGEETDFLVDWDRFSEITPKFAPFGNNILTGDRVQTGQQLIVPAQSPAIMEFKK